MKFIDKINFAKNSAALLTDMDEKNKATQALHDAYEANDLSAAKKAILEGADVTVFVDSNTTINSSSNEKVVGANLTRREPMLIDSIRNNKLKFTQLLLEKGNNKKFNKATIEEAVSSLAATTAQARCKTPAGAISYFDMPILSLQQQDGYEILKMLNVGSMKAKSMVRDAVEQYKIETEIFDKAKNFNNSFDL